MIVSMRFWVRAARTPFFFEKTLTLRASSAVLEIESRLTNEGEEPVHCVWGEHIALGAPFLSEDCVIDLAGGTLINEEGDDWHPEQQAEGRIQGTVAHVATQGRHAEGPEQDSSEELPVIRHVIRR